MRAPLRLRDEREREVVKVWREGHLSPGSVKTYLSWVRRFRRYCRQRKLDEINELIMSSAGRFIDRYEGPRTKGAISPDTRAIALRSLHAWACGLAAIGLRAYP